MQDVTSWAELADKLVDKASGAASVIAATCSDRRFSPAAARVCRQPRVFSALAPTPSSTASRTVSPDSMRLARKDGAYSGHGSARQRMKGPIRSESPRPALISAA